MKNYVLFKVYFGRSSEKIGNIRDHVFHLFLTDFVDGLISEYTITHGRGQWSGLKEKVTMLETLVERDRGFIEFTEFKLTEIAKEYKERMQQEKVLITRQDVTATLI